MKKILINFASIDRSGIDLPRLLKFKALNSLGCKLFLLSGLFLREIKPAEKDVNLFNEEISELMLLPKIRPTKIGYMFYALKMNIRAFGQWKRITKSNFDVFYSPAAVLDMVLFPYMYKIFHKEIKWVAVFDNIVPLGDPGDKIARFLAWIFFKMSMVFLKKADKIFIVSEDLRGFLLKRGFDKDKLVSSSNGIDNELIKKAVSDKRYKIDALFMGRINDTKGIYDMLKVLEIVRKKYPNFQLAIMGDGDEKTKKKFKKKIKTMSLESNVQFLGFISGIEKFNIMKSAKCFWFLSVSKSESFGVALLEAVCSGLPAFVYNLPQFSRIYPNGEVDISPMGDYELVASKVIGLFERGDFTNKKGKKMLGKYSWDKVAQIEFNAIANL